MLSRARRLIIVGAHSQHYQDESITKEDVLHYLYALLHHPEEAFEYRLGSRSAVEWVIEQYQVKGESDPNREDDPGCIVRLVGQVVRVSVETTRIVKGLPEFR